MNILNLFKGRSCFEHVGKKIILVCFNEKCTTNKLTCDDCISKHSEHVTQLKGVNNIENIINKLITECNTKIDGYNLQINDLNISMSYVKRIIAIKFKILVDQFKNQFDIFSALKCSHHQKDILMICGYSMCKHFKSLLGEQTFKKASNKLREKWHQKFEHLNFAIDKLSQNIVQFQKFINDKYKTSSRDLFELSNTPLSLKISDLQIFNGKGEDAQKQLEYFQLILREMKLSLKSDEEVFQNSNQIKKNRQQSIANNFEKILYIYGKKFDKIDEVNPFILHKGEILRMLKKFDQSIYWYDKVLISNSQCKEALRGKGKFFMNESESLVKKVQYFYEQSLRNNIMNLQYISIKHY